MDIRSAALSYLEHRMRTAKEMERRLKEKGFEEGEIAETMEWLKESRYIDDVAYGTEYLRYAFGKSRGINRAKIEMSERGISPGDIEKAIFAYEDENDVDIMEEEERRAMAEGENMVHRNGRDEKAMAKLGRRLNSLGYSTGLIYKVINRYRNPDS